MTSAPRRIASRAISRPSSPLPSSSTLGALPTRGVPMRSRNGTRPAVIPACPWPGGSLAFAEVPAPRDRLRLLGGGGHAGLPLDDITILPADADRELGEGDLQGVTRQLADDQTAGPFDQVRVHDGQVPGQDHPGLAENDPLELRT